MEDAHSTRTVAAGAKLDENGHLTFNLADHYDKRIDLYFHSFEKNEMESEPAYPE